MEFWKTDLSLFSDIEDYKYRPHFIEYEKMRMHYIDEGEGICYLALHGEPTWSYLYRHFIEELKPCRFIAPDLLGFGKSDKLKNWQDYSFEFHFNSLVRLIKTLELKNINLIVQDWGGLLGLSLVGAFPELFDRLIIMNTFLPSGKSLPIAFRLWQLYSRYHPSLPVGKIIQKNTFNQLDDRVVQAYERPFPDKIHKTGPKSFPSLVPTNKQDPAVPYLLKAREVLSEWQKPALVMFSDKDRVFSGLEGFFHKLIPSCREQPRIIIHEAGHFLQEEKPVEICYYIKLFLEEKIGKSI